MVETPTQQGQPSGQDPLKANRRLSFSWVLFPVVVVVVLAVISGLNRKGVIVEHNSAIDSEGRPIPGERSTPAPAENEAPDDKGEEEIEEYGSRTQD